MLAFYQGQLRRLLATEDQFTGETIHVQPSVKPREKSRRLEAAAGRPAATAAEVAPPTLTLRAGGGVIASVSAPYAARGLSSCCWSASTCRAFI